MQAQVDIEFEQLVKLVKQLPPTKWSKLKKRWKKKYPPPVRNQTWLNYFYLRQLIVRNN